MCQKFYGDTKVREFYGTDLEKALFQKPPTSVGKWTSIGVYVGQYPIVRMFTVNSMFLDAFSFCTDYKKYKYF